MNKYKKFILPVIAWTGFFVQLWVGCWLLCGGPDGQNAWMFVPILFQIIATMVVATIATAYKWDEK
jgi:hypothetical protein